MYAQRVAVSSLTTNASGDATGYTEAVTGRVLGIIYTIGTFAAGVDLTITAEATGEAILTLTNANSSANYYPRVGVHDSAGAAALYAAAGTAVREPVTVVNDRVKVVVAQGGDTKTGTVAVIIG